MFHGQFVSERVDFCGQSRGHKRSAARQLGLERVPHAARALTPLFGMNPSTSMRFRTATVDADYEAAGMNKTVRYRAVTTRILSMWKQNERSAS